MSAVLTELELETLADTGRLANNIKKIIGTGATAEHDWAEAAHHIHNIQHFIMAQAAARAYPDQFRLLGGVIEPACGNG